ncbi:MAG: CCA tRNA nucleotidyltransferase [Dehalococcoidia bacterium]
MNNLYHQLKSALSPSTLQLLRNIGQTADKRGERVSLVGGVVRDMLLKRKNLDLDLVVEGRAISLARQLAKENNFGLKTHPRFGTATIQAENLSLDMVTARSETYERPGALPAVKAGSIEDDLARRDFTINAMAICLSPDSFGKLLDPHGGRRDLSRKLIRILHPQSFKDDPTRILRAIRYEQRLNFHLEAETAKLLQRDLRGINTVTVERLWHELELILKEEQPEKIILRAENLGVLPHLHPSLKGDNWLAKKFARARDSDTQSLILPSVYLAIIACRLGPEEAEDFAARLKMPAWAARAVRNASRLKGNLASLQTPELLPSQIYHKLKRQLPEAVKGVAIASDSPVVKQRLELYLDELRYVKCQLSGNNLQEMGVPPGKKMGRILRTLKDARLDKEIKNMEEEKELVYKLI